MRRLLKIIKKEVVEISREPAAIILLIVMPIVFIIIMSLTMQPLYQSHKKFRIKIHVTDHDNSIESKKFISIIENLSNMELIELSKGMPLEDVSKLVAGGDYKFVLMINAGFAAYIRDLNHPPSPQPVNMLIDPGIQMLNQLVVRNQLEFELIKLRMLTFLDKNEEVLPYVGLSKEKMLKSLEGGIEPSFAYKNKRETLLPSAAQQNVPGWLVFAMYYIVVPISTIFLTEKSNGTLLRLRSINVNPGMIIFGKMFSYYFVCMLMAVCMLAVGVYVVPLLGGDTISLGNSYAGLFVISSCVSLNAIAYGLLISSMSKNIVSSIAFGAVTNIVFAGIGGVMVPKFVMPAFMQQLSNISLMSWGLDGFLGIMLRGGTVSDILPQCAVLIITGIIMTVIAGFALNRKSVK
jgi:ABC-2 type transport system permease protein